MGRERTNVIQTCLHSLCNSVPIRYTFSSFASKPSLCHRYLLFGLYKSFGEHLVSVTQYNGEKIPLVLQDSLSGQPQKLNHSASQLLQSHLPLCSAEHSVELIPKLCFLCTTTDSHRRRICQIRRQTAFPTLFSCDPPTSLPTMKVRRQLSVKWEQ